MLFKIQKKYLILIITFIVVTGFDQWSKNFIMHHMHLGESWSVVTDFFNITYAQNKGAAFSLLANTPDWFRVPFFFIVPTVALIGIAIFYMQLKKDDLLNATGYALIFSGAIGNLLDRFRFGFVVDFIDVHYRFQTHFPTFNIADSAICVGVGLLMLETFFTKGNENASSTI